MGTQGTSSPSRHTRTPAIAGVLGALLLLSCLAATAREADSGLAAFLAGDYEMIGRQPDGGATYAGTVTVSLEGESLHLVRVIGGVRAEGTARVEERTGDRIRILVAEFPRGDESLEAWCLIAADLDHYPRLSCLVRRRGVPTEKPGLEAWFYRVPPEG